MGTSDYDLRNVQSFLLNRTGRKIHAPLRFTATMIQQFLEKNPFFWELVSVPDPAGHAQFRGNDQGW